MSLVTDRPVAGTPRVIALDAVHNLRDLGGYPTADGRSTRWRQLFRADGLHRLRGDDLLAVRSLGLRTVIDLRSNAELAGHGQFPVDDLPVAFHHAPLIDVTWDPQEAPADTEAPGRFLLEKYLEILDHGEHRVAGIFQALALPGALPAVFHCAAGKDRTGVVAALVLSALGVPDDVVVADYALTAAAMERMRAWAQAASPEWAAMFADQPAAHLAADPWAMARLLGLLAAAHGSTREYVRSLGVTNALLYELEEVALEPQ